MAQRDWDGEWRAGQWDFLGQTDEQARLRLTARMITRFGAGPLVDLGSGDGQLLRHVDPRDVPSCLCVDVSPTALERIDGGGIQVIRMLGDLNNLTPRATPATALVCTEILYYLDAPDRVLSRWVAVCSGLRAVVLSIAEPGERFPQWREPVARVQQTVSSLGWLLLEAATVVSGAQRWAVCAYRPG